MIKNFSIIAIVALSGLMLLCFTTTGNTETITASLQANTELDEVEYSAYPFYRPITLGSIKCYQILISPTKGSSCPMTPNCSLYGYQVFSHQPPIRAFFMTADRLHRCGHDIGNYDMVASNADIKFSDPSAAIYGPSATQTSRSTRNESMFPDRQEQNTSTSEQRLLDFASALLNAGEYEQAIIEFRRFLFYYPESTSKEHAMEAIYFGYYYQKRYLDAAHWAENSIGKFSGARKNKMMFYLGDAYFLLQNYPLARNYLSQVENGGNEYYYRSIMLSGFSHARELQWDAADASFAQIPPTSSYYAPAQHSRSLILDGKKLAFKKPVTAGVLALVPGAGYWYDGYPQTALSSFIVTTAFIWGTIEAFRGDHQSLGVMLGVLSFGWYGGNIYGSMVSADRKNDRMKKELLSRFNLGFAP